MAVVAERPAVRSGVRAGTPTCVVDVVVPVYNDGGDLVPCVERLHAFLSVNLPYPFRITVADNASTDGTWSVAQRLAGRFDEVEAVHLDRKGRGGALKDVWSASDAAVVAYMDVDLSTDLSAFLPLVAPLISGHSDVAIGSRLSRTSNVVRGPKRELISRCYNVLLRRTLHVGFRDAQCGFKAMRADCARRLLPLVEDRGWFFDTELLVLAERAGMRVFEVPVDWVDDPDSSVHIVSTASDDLRGVARLLRGFFRHRIPVGEIARDMGRTPLRQRGNDGPMGWQLMRFGVIGAVSTAAYLALFAWLRGGVGAQLANLFALSLCTVANTAANRRITFGVTEVLDPLRLQLEGGAVFLVGLALTSVTLGAMRIVVPAGSAMWDLAAVAVANLMATASKFVLFRHWVFAPGRGRASA